MSETFKQFEAETQHLETIERIGSGEEIVSLPEKAAPEMAKINTEALSDTAKQTAETNSSAAEVLKQLENESVDQQIPSSVIGKMQRQVSYQHSIKQVRRGETRPSRALSHVIHQPLIRAVSEVSSKSVMRPSGLLGGGLAAFVGSGVYLLATKLYHFKYNYTMSLLLFVGGFCLGLVLELAVHLLTTSRRQLD
jgi:hypothetical protein